MGSASGYTLTNQMLGNGDRIYRAIFDRVAQSRPVFLIHTGDLVADGTSSKDWREFDRLNAIFRKNRISFSPVLGNHDCGSQDHTLALSHYFQHFPNLKRQRWYSFTCVNSGFIMLDSNFKCMTPEEITAQDQWLDRTVSDYQHNPQISFILAVTHWPPYTNCVNKEPNKEIQTRFLPVLTKSPKFRFFFSGHCHTYERFRINGANYVVSGGGGAPIYELLPIAKWRYEDEYDSSGTRPRGFNFCLITVYKECMKLQSLHFDSKQFSWTKGDEFIDR